MGNRYSKIQSSIWGSEKFNAVNEFAQKVYLYLLCCPHGNSAGFYRLPVGYATTDLRCSDKRFKAAMAAIENAELISTDGDVVLIHQFLRWNPYNNPKHAQGSRTEIADLERSRLYWTFYREVETHCIGYISEFPEPINGIDTVSEQYLNGIDTVSVPRPDQDHNQDHNQDQEKDQSAHAREDIFATFWKAYPKKKAKGDAEKAWNKLKPDNPLLDTMLAAIESQKTEKESLIANKQFCPEWPYPATWLNGRRWEDEETEQGRASPKSGVDEKTIEKYSNWGNKK